MEAQRWDVIACCQSCGLIMRVDLATIGKVRGPGFSLWNRMSRCRRLGCSGIVEFQAKAPGMTVHERLEAPWPDGRPALPAKGGPDA